MAGLLQHLSPLLVLGAVAIFLDQAVEAATSLYPAHLESVHWRFGAFGLLAGRITSVLVADLFLVLALWSREDPRAVRAWAWIHLTLGVFAILVTPLFVLDALQIRATVQSAALVSFYLGSARVAGLVVFLGCVWIFFGTRTLRRVPRSRDRSGSSKLLIERPEGGAAQ